MGNIISKDKQFGGSMWGLLLGAALFILFALVTMKLVPAYLDNNKVMNALESVSKKPGVAHWTRRQISDQIDNTLYIDMAADLVYLKDALSITKTKTMKVISVDYERVVPMAYNISALLDFENSVEVPLK